VAPHDLLIRAGQIALCTAVGPAGALLGPAANMLAEWLGSDPDNEWLKPALAAGGGMAGNLGADSARALGERLGESGNHDLERTAAEAIQAALRQTRQRLAPAGRMLVNNHSEWFDAWEARLQEALGGKDELVTLFQKDEQYDPVRLADATGPAWWLEIRPLLILWPKQLGLALGEDLPADLDAQLAGKLQAGTEAAARLLLRQKGHARGWIGWQQSFLLEIAKSVRESHRDLADGLEALASQVGSLELVVRDEHVEHARPYHAPL
jgi:hypothetical protein